MFDEASTIVADAVRGGRVSGKVSMARPEYQNGSLVIRGKRGKKWVLRWRENVLEANGKRRRVQRAETLGPISQINRQQARATLRDRINKGNQQRHQPRSTMPLEQFVREEWRPKAGLALRKSSLKYYGLQLDRHVIPVLGSTSLCDLSRAAIEAVLSNLKQKGLASATIRGVRAAISTVLRSAVKNGYVEKNMAHGILIGETRARRERRSYTPDQVRQLLAVLTEPCRSVVQLAVHTGMRIGEILALRWKRVDLLRGTIEIAESWSDGEFGPPKTRSSYRVIPISEFLQALLEAHHTSDVGHSPEDLVLRTRTGAPLSSQNLYNRVLAPACDRINLPRISWHSFRHTHSTLLTDVGESIKTTQSLLGNSDLATTLNTYSHAVPESQRRAVERVSNVLFPDVLKLNSGTTEEKANSLCSQDL